MRRGVVGVVAVPVRIQDVRREVRVFGAEGVAVLEFLGELRGRVRREGYLQVVVDAPRVHLLAGTVPFHLNGRLLQGVESIDVVDPDDAGLLDELQPERLEDPFQNLLPVEGDAILVDEVLGRDGERGERHGGIIRELRGRVGLVDGAVVDTGRGEGPFQDLAQRLRAGEAVRDAAERSEVVEGQLHVVVVVPVVGLVVGLRVQAAGPVQDIVPVDVQADVAGGFRVQVRIGPVAGRLDGERRHGSADRLLGAALVPLDGEGLVGGEDKIADLEGGDGLLEDLTPPDVPVKRQKFPGISQSLGHR